MRVPRVLPRPVTKEIIRHSIDALSRPSPHSLVLSPSLSLSPYAPLQSEKKHAAVFINTFAGSLRGTEPGSTRSSRRANFTSTRYLSRTSIASPICTPTCSRTRGVTQPGWYATQTKGVPSNYLPLVDIPEERVRRCAPSRLRGLATTIVLSSLSYLLLRSVTLFSAQNCRENRRDNRGETMRSRGVPIPVYVRPERLNAPPLLPITPRFAHRPPIQRIESAPIETAPAIRAEPPITRKSCIYDSYEKQSMLRFARLL